MKLLKISSEYFHIDFLLFAFYTLTIGRKYPNLLPETYIEIHMVHV